MTFGKKLANLRKQSNLTKQDLAEKLNLSKQSIAKWEKDLELPDLNSIKKLSSIFNICIDELLDYKIEHIKLDLETSTETIDKKDSKLNKVNSFILEKFKNAESIEMLIREKKLSIWQELFDILFIFLPDIIELANFISTGFVHSFLVKEKNELYLVLINKTTLITKKLNNDFEKSIDIDGYTYSKYKNNKLK